MSERKELLKQLREEKYAAEAQKQYEFQQAARENYEHSKSLKEGLSTKNRSGGSEGVFAKQTNLPIPQPMHKNGGQFSMSDGTEDSGRFEGHQHRNTPRQGGSNESKENNLDPRQVSRVRQQKKEESSPISSRDSRFLSKPGNEGAASCEDKYEQMLSHANHKRVREKALPRSTNFY